MNPFMYGKPVSGDYFFGLSKLAKEIEQFIKNKISLVIIGPRRFGKTSFVRNLLDDFRKKGWIAIDVDAFNVTSHRDFLLQLILAMTKEKKQLVKIVDWLKKLPALSPQLKYEIDPRTNEGSFAVSLHKAEQEDIKQAILHTLDGIHSLGRKIIVSIDEFQKIGELEDAGWLEATLRSKMQQHTALSFIFTGSRRSLIEDLFNNSKRPFYRSCKIIHFPTNFGPDFSNWIILRFKKADVSCDLETIEYLRQRVKDTPHYIQEVCFHLVSRGVRLVTAKEIDETLDTISAQSTYSYESLLNTLTQAQIQFLRMLVTEGAPTYSKEMLARYEFKNPSNIQAAIKALIEKQIIEKDPSTKCYQFDDLMFNLWLTKQWGSG